VHVNVPTYPAWMYRKIAHTSTHLRPSLCTLPVLPVFFLLRELGTVFTARSALSASEDSLRLKFQETKHIGLIRFYRNDTTVSSLDFLHSSCFFARFAPAWIYQCCSANVSTERTSGERRASLKVVCNDMQTVRAYLGYITFA
jgi:hypothetical protein